VSGGADASRGVDRQADVADLGERGSTAVNADAHADIQLVGPRVFANGALDGDRSIESGDGTFEDREEFVGARIDLAAASP